MIVEYDIKPKIQQFILNHFIKEPGSKLDDDISLLEKGIIDSTGVMELVAFLESDFGVRVEDEEIVPDNLDSVNKISKYVKAKLKA